MERSFAGRDGGRPHKFEHASLPHSVGFFARVMESPALGERLPPIWHSAFLVDMTNEAGLGWRFKMVSEAIVTIAHQRNVVERLLRLDRASLEAFLDAQ
jgi:hypothetical protein